MGRERLTIKDLPEQERPREKLKLLGAEALSNAELLAVLLRIGTRQESVLELATRLLSIGGGLRGLVDLSLEEMVRLGIGPAKAVQIKAAFELGRRLAPPRPDQDRINNPRQAAELFMEELRYKKKNISFYYYWILRTRSYAGKRSRWGA